MLDIYIKVFSVWDRVNSASKCILTKYLKYKKVVF